ncbi:unnamed protein product [Cylindrotheca closterium]|uniref:2'-phosphotransferase n=1 Tax=Cylindrotheca closterium TaxID=2856 RepID=A0AAD2PUT6_9STRA|nr:unnamed protein product [Cylindrotheca closterium]
MARKRKNTNGESGGRGGGSGSQSSSTDTKSKNSNNRPLTGKKLSHALSWALRHQALAIGLTILPDGYVPVDEILSSTHPKLKGATLEEIQKMVETNDKQRFRLDQKLRSDFYGISDVNADETIICIRANQGHSIKTINPELLFRRLSPEELRTLPCIVHGTYVEPWKSIQKTGLKKMNRTHMHFASGLPDADGVISGMRKTSTIFIFVDPVKCAEGSIEFFISANGVILSSGIEGTLPPTYFSHVTGTSGDILMDNRS